MQIQCTCDKPYIITIFASMNCCLFIPLSLSFSLHEFVSVCMRSFCAIYSKEMCQINRCAFVLLLSFSRGKKTEA